MEKVYRQVFVMNTTYRFTDQRKTSVLLVTDTNRKKNRETLMSQQNTHIRNIKDDNCKGVKKGKRSTESKGEQHIFCCNI